MLKFFKFFLAFLSLILLIFLVNISFLSVNEFKEDKLSFLNSINSKDYLQEISIGKGNMLVYNTKINFFDNIFHTKKDSFNIEENLGNININLNSGIFILDLNDLSKKYTINSKSTNFSIDLKSTGSIYIDTTSSKIKIFSINSSFVLNFLNNDSNIMNSYFVYPHEYIKFNYKLNFIYKNVDLYRIRTTTKNGYFKYKILNNSKVDSNISFIIGKENLDFFTSYIENKVGELNNNNILYKKLTSLENYSFPFSHYIDKYSYYFVNNSKKIAYLQNTIYNNLIDLFNSNKLNISLINNVKENLKILKSLDEDKYKKVNSIIDNFYKIISGKNNLTNNHILNNFVLLKFEDKKTILELENYIILKKIYFNYDFKNLDKTSGYFNLFLDSYLSKSGIKQENENFTLNKTEKLSEIESFVFFLRGYIYENLFLNDLDKIDSHTNILNKYINLNKMIYFSGKTNEIKIRTSLSENLKILKKLELYLKNNFFEQNRQKDTELLILKEKKINIKNLKVLELEIDKLFEAFISNISLLEKINDEKTINQYKNINILLKEEFFAINDYEKYRLENNKKLKELYDLSILGNETEKKYDDNYVSSYLSSFEGLSFNKKNISKNGNNYIIKNISILGKNYDMYLTPSLGNLVKIINRETNTNVSYDLDNMEVLLKEKQKGATEEERYKYEFKNFFVQRFKKQTISGNNDLYDKCYFENKISDGKGGCKEIVNDNSAITVIKRDKLIGGEFKIIKDFFAIKYENLSVDIDGSVVNIEISKANIVSNIKLNSTNKNYNLEFYSSYNLENHEFSNISLKFKNPKDKELYLYGGAKFEFKNKKVEIKKLKQFIDDFLKDLQNIDSIYSVLRGEIIFNNLKISYINNEVYLKFENNGKNINIKIKGDIIYSITVGGKEILDESINISEPTLILDKLR